MTIDDGVTRAMSGSEPLDVALRAATVPGHPAELAGEDAAVAAFRAAAPVPALRHRPLLARVFTVRTTVIGIAAVAAGVVVVAAGVLPLRPAQEPATTPTVGPASMTTEASVPAMPPLDGPNSRTAEQTGPTTTSSREPGHDRDRDRGPGDDEDKKDKGAEPPGHAKSPGSPAQGAVTAVPPTGAKPPTKGG
jgi:hypothetical protein